MVKALVTGGAGFVGKHLVEALVERGHTVTVFDKVRVSVPIGARLLIGDLSAGDLFRETLSHQDVVYHFAANASPHTGKTNPTLDLEENLLATARLLEDMRQARVPRIVFASSSSVYGDCSVFPTPEDAPIPNQTSLYGASKMACEGLISAYTYAFGMQATIFRFAPMIGEGYRRGHVKDFYDKIKANPAVIQILGNGKQKRSYVYVKDAIAAVVDTAVPGTFNVSGDDPVSVNQSLSWITDEMGIRPVREYTYASWAGDKALTFLDTSRLRAMGWSPQVSIEEAVRRTVRSFGT